MERALAPAKICPSEDAPEIKADTNWATLLSKASDIPTALRPLQDPAARARYAPEGEIHKLLLLESLVSEQECDRLNRAAEAVGFGKTNYPQDYRGNLRLITTDPGLSTALWERVRPLVPDTLEFDEGRNGPQGGTGTWRAVGLNEVFRIAKYYEGHRFGAHCDAWFERNREERSFYTVNLYTNSVAPEHGGRTRFYGEHANGRRRVEPTSQSGSDRIDLAVQPEAGLAVVFRHGPRTELLHDGERLGGGVKYLLRTDVMYRRAS